MGEQRAGRCWLFHAWTRWALYEHVERGVIAKGFLVGDRYVAEQVRQRRTCLRCGFTEDQLVRSGPMKFPD